MEAVTVYLGLGTNLGGRQSNLTSAVRRLNDNSRIKVTRCSSVYESAPWGFTDQPRFLNCVAVGETTLEPVLLLELVKRIEQAQGREQTFRYGPRVIDIDILLYGEAVISLDDPDLQIPHARMTERAFVLVPLAEIATDLSHPSLNTTIASLCQQVEGKEEVRLWGPPVRLSEAR